MHEDDVDPVGHLGESARNRVLPPAPAGHDGGGRPVQAVLGQQGSGLIDPVRRDDDNDLADERAAGKRHDAANENRRTGQAQVLLGHGRAHPGAAARGDNDNRSVLLHETSGTVVWRAFKGGAGYKPNSVPARVMII